MSSDSNKTILSSIFEAIENATKTIAFKLGLISTFTATLTVVLLSPVPFVTQSLCTLSTAVIAVLPNQSERLKLTHFFASMDTVFPFLGGIAANIVLFCVPIALAYVPLRIVRRFIG